LPSVPTFNPPLIHPRIFFWDFFSSPPENNCFFPLLIRGFITLTLEPFPRRHVQGCSVFPWPSLPVTYLNYFLQNPRGFPLGAPHHSSGFFVVVFLISCPPAIFFFFNLAMFQSPFPNAPEPALTRISPPPLPGNLVPLVFFLLFQPLFAFFFLFSI